VRLTVDLDEADHPDVEVTVTRATQRHLDLAEGLRVWVAPTNGARSTAPMRIVSG
jgi:sulfate transport system ATP-binding protein